MGKVKRQRKQWRNIDTSEVDEYLEKSTREKQQRLVVEGIPDADLFYVDTDPFAAEQQQQDQATPLPRKLQHRQRITRAAAILQAAHAAAPASQPWAKKSKPNTKPTKSATKAQARKQKSLLAALEAKSKAEEAQRRLKAGEVDVLEDLWGDGDNGGNGGDDIKTKNDDWTEERATAPANPAKRRLKRGLRPVAAVEVDHPGCSFNPDREIHQDAVAAAVAAEMRKAYDAELVPTAPVATVGYDVETDELALLQVDEASDDDDDDDDGSDDGGSPSDDDVDDEDAKMDKKTNDGANNKKSQKVRNREARRKALEEEEARRREEKRQRHQLSQLGAIRREVDATLAEQEARRERREADRREREAAEPPRLGRHRFAPMPLQVLATAEIEEGGGSLRRLKPTAMLAKDRFKSLERRGVIEVRQKATKKKGKRVEFVHGKRGDKALERQAEVIEARERTKKLKEAKKK